MTGELPEDVKATLSILDTPQALPPVKLKPTRTMDDIALPVPPQRPQDDVAQTLSILDGNQPTEVDTSAPNPRDIEADVLKMALRKGVNSNTALAAHRKSVAKKLDIAPDLVTPQAEETAFYQDHNPEDLQKNYPALAKYLGVQGNAEVVGKNLDTLKEVETFYRRSENDPAIALAKGVIGVGQVVVGLGNLVSGGKAGKYVEEKGLDLRKIQSVLNDLYSAESQKVMKDVGDAKGFWNTVGTALKNPSSVGLMTVESLPQMYLGGRIIGGALQTAFPALSFGTAGAIGEGVTMAGGSAEQIRSLTDSGELTGKQTALSLGVGFLGTGLSALGNKLATKFGFEDPDADIVAGKLLNKLQESGVPKPLAVRIIGGAAIEGGVEEMPQSIVEQIAQNVALDRPWSEGVENAAALGLVTGGAMGAAFQVGANPSRQAAAPRETPAEKQARAVVQNTILKTAAAVKAEDQRNAIQDWGKRIKTNDTLRKESPESFKEFIRTMSDEDGAVKEVFVDAKLLNETLAQTGIDRDQLAKDMPEVAEGLADALATNGEVRIPIEDYAAYIVGTPVENAILDHLRTTPDGMTYAESQVFFQQQQEDFVKQAESLINLNEPVLTRKEFTAQAPEGMQYKDYLQAHKNKVEAFATDLKEVHDSLLTGLESTGRFPKSISRVYAIPFREFYATNAARMGILPTELYKSLPLNFAKMQTADILAPSAGTLSQQGAKTLPETVNVDGVDRPTMNSNGKPIYPTEEGIRNFWKWFGDSKVVDAQGRPLVVYHGAPDARFMKEDAVFKTLGEKYGANEPDKRAFWFSSSRISANTYADDRRAFDYQNSEPGIVEGYLKLDNPLIVEANGVEWRSAQKQGRTGEVITQARKDGNDGVFIRNVKDDYNNSKTTRTANTFTVFSSNQIKSAIGNNGEFDPNNPSILAQSTFYSALERNISGLNKLANKQGIVKTDQAKAWIEARQKEGKFKKEEVEAVGLLDWLDAQEGKVPVADIENFVKENGVQLEETLLGGTVLPIAVQEHEDQPEIYTLYRADDPDGGYYGMLGEIIQTEKGEYEINVPDFTGRIHYPTLQEALERVSRGSKQFSETKFESYVLPGGTNYRELLLTLPGKEGQAFKSAHFDQPNILAHVRVDERTVGGQRVLFVEEIQSDWAQQGRDKGFQQTLTAEEKEYLNLMDRFRDKGLTSEEQTRVGELRAANIVGQLQMKSGGIPTGPFVQNTKSWTALAVKRLLRYAAENGFDKIAWTTGEQQAARYSEALLAVVDEIRYKKNEDGTFTFVPYKDGNGVHKFEESNVPISRVSEVLGKDIASKMEEGAGRDDGGIKVLEGLDLKIGGEGMKAFYDQIVPQVVNEVSKKLGGGKVDVTDFRETFEQYMTRRKLFVNPADGAVYASQSFDPRTLTVGSLSDIRKQFEANRPESDLEKQHSLDITPEMRDKIMQGLPLFQGNRAGFNPSTFTISLLQGADLSSVIHEGAHFYLEALADLAGRENAPQQIKDDFRTTLDWFGIASSEPNTENQQPTTPLPPGATPEEIWARMTLDQKRPYHEQWAQSYERYTLEGKAPTVEMQSVFARFREWMLSVYNSMKDFLAQNPLAGKLNDDIRSVFDRLIASEEKIYQAEEARGYASLFGSAAEAGLSEPEYEKYQELGKLASSRAVDNLTSRSIRDMRWLSNAKDKTIKKLQAEANAKRAAVTEQVTDEVDAMPLNRARNFLTTGEFIDEAGVRRESDTKFKLNEAEVKTLVNGEVPADIKGMVSPDGVGLELAANLLGFQSPETLVDQLVNGESRDVTIQGMTDQRMLEQYGDLTDDKAIERAAEKAIHNEARARFMATGLKLLTKTELSAAQLNRAAKMAAESTIAKKKIRSITPGQFTRAEAKANREALDNVARDPKKAIDAQRAALLNNRLAKAALEAADDVEAILKYFKKFDSKGVRKAVGIDQMDQIDDLLQEVDRDKSLPLKEIDKRQALADWVAEQEADNFEPVIDPVQAEQIKAKHYKDMTVDELRMLRDTVKQIEHIGRLKQTLLTEMDRADFRERVDEAERSIRDNANRTVEEKGTPTDVIGETNRWVRQMVASHRKFSSFIREMDGGKDGGVMWRLLSKNMNAAGDNEVEMRRASSEAVADLFKLFEQEKAPLNLYAKRMRIPGTDFAMTQEQRIMFGMNWGNSGNRQRALDGGVVGKRALSIVEAQAILDTLTKQEWDFIQGTWGHIATYKDQIAALERRLTGIEPAWVEPSEVKTKYGTYRGGYFPAKYDTELSTRSESLEAVTDTRMGMKGAFNAAATRKGFTQQRSEAVVNRPLLLSYNVIANHISEVTHRLAWQPWLIDANRVLKALDAPIRQHYGAEVLREMRNTVTDIAAGDVGSRTPMEKAINHLRAGSTIVGMGWRFSTAFLQPSGLAQSWARIGGKWVAKGVAETFKNLNQANELVNSKSSLMKNRDITMNREINDVLNRVRTNEGMNALTGSYFSLIGKMQRVVDIPTWFGAYEKALHDLKLENATTAEERARIESDAVALADQAVIDSQSGGQLKDLASIQRGHPGLKLFTNFYSYFSATYNLNIEALRRTNFRSPTDLAFLAGDLVLLNVLPVLFSLALKEATKGECGDDTDCLIKRYGYEQAGYMFGQMILLRDMGSAALVAAGGDQYGYSGPAGLRFFSDLYKAGVQVNQGELDWPLFKSVSNTAGVLLHFPTGQINTTLEGIMAVENGDVDGVSVLPALLFGPPKD